MRALLTGVVLVAAISLISPWAVLIVKGSLLTGNAIPVIAVLFFFVLTALVSPLLKSLSRHLAFTRADLILIYAMMLVAGAVVTTGFTGGFMSIISGIYYYATPENNWANLFIPHLDPWVTPQDLNAVHLFFEGLPPDASIPWSAWAIPLAAWTSFMVAFSVVTFCLGVMLRGQWIDRERLVFPLTQLPLAMMEDAESAERRVGRFFKSRLLWLGILLPLLLHSWNSLHNYHDAFQPVAVKGRIPLLDGRMSVPFLLNFPVLGLSYLMPLGVSFSLWFFCLVGLLEQSAFARIGVQLSGGDMWTSGGASPPLSLQMSGAMLILVLFVLWNARQHLGSFWRQALGREESTRRELLGPRAAVCGFAGGLLFMSVWLISTGLDVYVAILLVVGALVVFIGLARITCEAGLPSIQTPMVPQAFMIRGFGPQVLGLQNMTGLGLSTVWLGDTAANMMNSVMHSLRLSSGQERHLRHLPWALLLALVIALAGSIWYTMSLAYTHGGINLHGWYFRGIVRWPFNHMASLANAPEASFAPRLTFITLGAGVMGVLLYLRQRFLAWPLHPIGFPVSNTHPIITFGWLSILLAWLCKAAILRYGGVRLYRTMRPFFLGLALGEFSASALWVFIDGAFGVEGNMIFVF